MHDLNAFQLATSMPVHTADVVVDDDRFHDDRLPELLDELQRYVAGQFAEY